MEAIEVMVLARLGFSDPYTETQLVES